MGKLSQDSSKEGPCPGPQVVIGVLETGFHFSVPSLASPFGGDLNKHHWPHCDEKLTLGWPFLGSLLREALIWVQRAGSHPGSVPSFFFLCFLSSQLSEAYSAGSHSGPIMCL